MSGPVPGTPTPWEVEEGHIQRDSNGIRYWQITDGQDAIACNQFCYAGYDPAVNAANAACIVHRVNNWDALEAERDALKARVEVLVEALSTVRDYVQDSASGHLTYSNSGDGFKVMAAEDLTRIDAALSLAKGEQP